MTETLTINLVFRLTNRESREESGRWGVSFILIEKRNLVKAAACQSDHCASKSNHQ